MTTYTFITRDQDKYDGRGTIYYAVGESKIEAATQSETALRGATK